MTKAQDGCIPKEWNFT